MSKVFCDMSHKGSAASKLNKRSVTATLALDTQSDIETQVSF